MFSVTSGHASQLSYTPNTETEKCKAHKGNKHSSANATHCLTVSCARPLNSSFRFSASCSDSWVPRSSCSVFSNSLETSPSFFVTSSNCWVIIAFCRSVSSSLSLVSFSWVIALAACFSRLSKSLARVWKMTTEFYVSSLYVPVLCSQTAYNNEIQTHKRFKRMLFIRVKHNMHIFRVIPFMKLQNDN